MKLAIYSKKNMDKMDIKWRVHPHQVASSITQQMLELSNFFCGIVPLDNPSESRRGHVLSGRPTKGLAYDVTDGPHERVAEMVLMT